MKGKMLSGGGYDRLLRCSTASECMSILQEEGYFQGMPTGIEPHDPTSWQKLFDAQMTRIVHKLANLSPDDCARLLNEIEGQYRLESLKSSLRLITARETEETQSDMIGADLGDDSLRSVVETRNIERLLQAAGAMSLHSEISSALSEKRPLPFVEAIVDKYGLARIWKGTDMTDWMDKESAQALVGEQIDLTNMVIVARYKVLGISAEQLQQSLVPVNYHLGDALSEAAGAGSTTNALRAFAKTIYGDSLARFLDTFKEGESLHPLDVLLRRRHASDCLSAFTGFPFCAGLPLAFTYLMSYEVSDLRSILSGKRDSLPAEKIKEFLVLQKVQW